MCLCQPPEEEGGKSTTRRYIATVMYLPFQHSEYIFSNSIDSMSSVQLYDSITTTHVDPSELVLVERVGAGAYVAILSVLYALMNSGSV